MVAVAPCGSGKSPSSDDVASAPGVPVACQPTIQQQPGPQPASQLPSASQQLSQELPEASKVTLCKHPTIKIKQKVFICVCFVSLIPHCLHFELKELGAPRIRPSDFKITQIGLKALPEWSLNANKSRIAH
jgi:hypothetical protein